MDSDSDSDASHISATPPRDLSPPSPAPPSHPPPPLPLASLASSKSRTRSTATPAAARFSSRPILKPKLTKPSSKFKNPKPEPLRDSLPDSIPPPNLSNLPFQIRRQSDQSDSHFIPSHSTETITAGGLRLSKFASFSNIRKPIPNLESTENNPSVSSLPTATSENNGAKNVIAPADMVNEAVYSGNSMKLVKNHPNLTGNNGNSLLSSALPQNSVDEAHEGIADIGNEVVHSGNSVKLLRKHPNLIGNNGNYSVPAKRPKCSNEGNFVKLNINGRGRKFKFKAKGKHYRTSAYGRRSFRRSKGKMKGKGEQNDVGVCDEGGLVLEGLLKQEKREHQSKFGFDLELLEEAIMAVRNEGSDESWAKLLKLTHGYDSFRDGQLEAIKMVIAGKSAMLVLPTGAGKSLCYQLPALVLPGFTLVISPLVALMIDQLKQLPPMIHGGLLCSSQTTEETSQTLRLLKEGKMKVLFISPERLLNAEFTEIISDCPPVSLVVIDEAHCVSEWSHNFRPAYMRLKACLFRAKFKAECVLALTATATVKTLHDVMCSLEIPPTNLIQMPQLRNNLQLSLSMSENKMKDLLVLLKSSPFVEVQSIIIYCKFQYETDLVSRYLCDNNISAKSYHSGLTAKDRGRTQELFCSNKIRVVVATVAFGMGLDKKDVGAVINYSLPESLEEYVQEIGRAGRDGRLSYCHLYFDDTTYFKLHSLMHSDGVDAYAVNKFLCQVFSNGMDSIRKFCSLVKESASRKFDMKEEVMLTILTQLELGEVQYLHLHPQMNVTCTINFHQTSPALLAAKDIIVAEILKKSERKDGQFVFDITAIANSIGVKVTDISNKLQSLKFKGEVTYELKDPAYCYTLVEMPKDVCFLAAHLTKWLSDVENSKVQKIDTMYNAAAFAVTVCDRMHGCCNSQHTSCLQKKILEYFSGNEVLDVHNKMGQSSPFLRADIKVFLQSNSQAKFTPRAVARIMHGIASPAFPSAVWSRSHFWGRYAQVEFTVVMEAAKVELMNFVGKDLI